MKNKILLMFALLAGAVSAQITPPANTAVVGQTVTLSVTADGTAPFTYQWYKDGKIWVGTTQQTVVFAKVQLYDAGTYTVDVINSAGKTTAPAVVFTVTAPLPVVVAPSNAKSTFAKQ